MGRAISLNAGDGAFAAYLAEPRGEARAGVVVLQEIFGIDANIRAIADDFAAAGFHAVAPDLFWRQRPGLELDPGAEADRALGLDLLRGLDEAAAVKDAATAADYARGLMTGSARVGAVGYCMGGKLAYLLAARGKVDGAVSYYGVGIQDALDEAGPGQSPLLLHIAAEDALCPPDAQRRIAEALATSPAIRIRRHAGVGHAFARRFSPAFDAAAAERADTATLAFLSETLDVA